MNDGLGKPLTSKELIERMTRRGDSEPQSVGRASADSRSVSMDVRRRVYKSSHLGARHGIRGEAMKAQPRSAGDTVADAKGRQSRLAGRVEADKNRPSAGFKEPSGRSYNPYS